MRRFVGTTVKTSGTTFTTGTNTTLIVLRLQAGGGAGGGAGTGAGTSAAGGGGAGGGYAEKTFPVTPNTTYTYSLGAAGAAGAAGANDGGAGGNTTFAAGGVTVTAFGGNGGKGMAGSATIVSALGGASPAVSTNGDVNGGGEPGERSFTLSATLAVSGKGGSSMFGTGGNGINVEGAGVAGTGYGAGGSGGMQDSNGTARAGGAGTAGLIVIDEYASSSAALPAPASIKSGKVAQIEFDIDGAVATGTTVIPYDDTAPPQITEGDQYMTVVITPTNANSTLLILIVATIDHSTASGTCTAALFVDSTADALAANAYVIPVADDQTTCVLMHKLSAGSTTERTYRFRAGGSAAGTTTFNGSNAGRIYGGVAGSMMLVAEILP